MSSNRYKKLPVLAWGGFVNGRLLIDDMDDGFGGYGERKRRVPCIFTNRQEAKQQFDDVRRIEIKEVWNE